MEKILELEKEKLIREFLYVQADYEYKWTLVQYLDQEFIKSVESFLSKHPHLKEVVEEVTAKKEISKSETLSKDADVVLVEEDSRIKYLYRKIAKETHPDKTDSSKMKEIYLKATCAYEQGEFFQLIGICEQLQIPYEIDDDDRIGLNVEIENVKAKIKFLENTYTLKWHLEQNQSERDRIVLTYISNHIGLKIN